LESAPACPNHEVHSQTLRRINTNQDEL